MSTFRPVAGAGVSSSDPASSSVLFLLLCLGFLVGIFLAGVGTFDCGLGWDSGSGSNSESVSHDGAGGAFCNIY